jgi:bla regulator protein BlaR1
MEPIVNNLIKAIGWSILHSLWQGAIIYAILFIVLMAMPKMTARLKHNLAFGALFLIFASFCITFFSKFELPTLTKTSIQNIELTQHAYQDLVKFSSTFNIRTESYFPLLTAIYMIGIIFQLIILSSGYLKLKKLKQASTLMVPAEWSMVFNTTLAQLKINKTVKFYLSPKVNVPLVIGFFKPAVLFPVALATQLDLKQVEAILIHELSHVRRNDYLVNLVKTCIETLLFFNPFVWLTTKFIHIEREHACDDLVVNFTGTPLTYAHALLKLELLKDKHVPALSLAATGKNQHLYQRIKRITDMKTNYINAKQQFLILTLTIATVVSLAWINPSKKPSNTSKKAKPALTLKVSEETQKEINEHLTVKSDTDTTKKKKHFNMVITNKDGKNVVYTSREELPDSLKKKIEELENQFSSPEWKEKMAKVAKDSEELSRKFNSPEWKDQIAKIQKNAEEMTKKFESKEWKDQMANAQAQAMAITKKFESKEWKEQMAKVQEHAIAMTKKIESKEWKEQMAKVQEQSAEMAKKFNSPEWKKKMEGIQKNAEELTKKFNSPEWKQKMEDIKKLQESPEYKELRKKYESDLEELKKKKGIKSDNGLIMFNSDNKVNKMFLSKDNLKKVYAAIPPLKIASNLKLDQTNLAIDVQSVVLPQTCIEILPFKN